MAKLKEFLTDSVVYGTGNALRKFIGLLLIPIFTRALSPEEYGITSTLSTLTFFIATITGLGLFGATSRYFFITKDENERGSILSTSIMLTGMVSIITTVVLIIFSSPISVMFFGTDKWALVVAVTLLTLPANQISGFVENIFRYYRAPLKYVYVTVLRSVVSPGFAILFVIVLKKGVLGVQLSTLVSTLVILAFAYFFYVRTKVNWVYSKKWAGTMLRFGFPLVWTSMLTWVYSVSDRLILLKFWSTKEVGLYSIGYSFSQPILLIGTAIQMSASVLILASYQDDKSLDFKDTKDRVIQYWNTYLILSVPFALFLSVYSVDMLRFFTTPKYIAGAFVIPFATFGHIMNQSMELTGIGMNLKEKSKPYFWIMLIAASVNVIMNFILIPFIGVLGAAISTLVANFVQFQIAYTWSQKDFYVKHKIKQIYLFWTTAFIICAIFPYLYFEKNMHLSFWIKTAVFIFSLFLPVLTGFITFKVYKENAIKGYNLIIGIKRKLFN